MGEKRDDGGPAFPNPARVIPDPHGDFVNDEHFAGMSGMSLRDYFAAKALQGILADPNVNANISESEFARIVAKRCYEYADAMLAERAKNGP